MKNILIFLFFTASSFCFSQNYYSEFLLEKRGFRHIKLGSPVENYPNLEKIDKSLYKGSLQYFYDYDYVFQSEDEGKLGESKILGLLVKEFEGKIVEILLRVEKRNDFNLIDMLWVAYGKPTSDNEEDDFLMWKALDFENNIRLELSVLGRRPSSNRYSLYYTDSNLQREMRKTKRRNKEKKAKSEF